MKDMTIKRSSTKLALSITAAIMSACGAQAYDLSLGTNLPPVTFHGFVSQGFLASSQYNYLGDTTRGSFLFTEAGLNASINPFPRTHITAQAFTYDVGQNVGKYDVVLDYATVEYTFNDYLGIRGGRLRRPEGIYNEIVDLDLARTFVLLPQGIYDARWRDFFVSLDGGDLFGHIPLNQAGDLSYEFYGGVQRPSVDGGLTQKILAKLPKGSEVQSMNSSPLAGVQLWWATPVDGLRLGAAYNHVLDFETKLLINLPPIFGGPKHATGVSICDISHGSVEYVWKNWTFQGEYQRTIIQDSPDSDAFYASAAYRVNKWFETGAYYSEEYNDTGHRNTAQLYQKDAALTLRFDLTDWWIFKVEGHAIHGTGLLQDNASNPVARQDDRLWFMLGVKTTFSF